MAWAKKMPATTATTETQNRNKTTKQKSETGIGNERQKQKNSSQNKTETENRNKKTETKSGGFSVLRHLALGLGLDRQDAFGVQGIPTYCYQCISADVLEPTR